jgi:hypothetical protein
MNPGALYIWVIHFIHSVKGDFFFFFHPIIRKRLISAKTWIVLMSLWRIIPVFSGIFFLRTKALLSILRGFANKTTEGCTQTHPLSTTPQWQGNSISLQIKFRTCVSETSIRKSTNYSLCVCVCVCVCGCHCVSLVFLSLQIVLYQQTRQKTSILLGIGITVFFVDTINHG